MENEDEKVDKNEGHKRYQARNDLLCNFSHNNEGFELLYSMQCICMSLAVVVGSILGIAWLNISICPEELIYLVSCTIYE